MYSLQRGCIPARQRHRSHAVAGECVDSAAQHTQHRWYACVLTRCCAPRRQTQCTYDDASTVNCQTDLGQTDEKELRMNKFLSKYRSMPGLVLHASQRHTHTHTHTHRRAHARAPTHIYIGDWRTPCDTCARVGVHTGVCVLCLSTLFTCVPACGSEYDQRSVPYALRSVPDCDTQVSHATSSRGPDLTSWGACAVVGYYDLGLHSARHVSYRLPEHPKEACVLHVVVLLPRVKLLYKGGVCPRLCEHLWCVSP